MVDFFEKNKKNIIILGILLLCLLLFVIFTSCNKKTKYINTIKSHNKSSLPHINIQSDNIEKINKKLKNEYEEIIDLNNESYFKYEYSYSNDVLSLLIEKGIKESENDFLEVEYKVYNISVIDKKSLEKDDIIALYDLDESNIKQTIESELQKQYNKEISDGYIPVEECKYSCFLEDKNYTSINDNVELFVKDDKVYGYLNIKNGSLYYDLNDYPTTKKIYELK